MYIRSLADFIYIAFHIHGIIKENTKITDCLVWIYKLSIYRQTSNISRTLVGNTIVDHSDIVGASPVGAAPTTSSFSTQHPASMHWAKATTRRDEFCGLVRLILKVWRYVNIRLMCTWLGKIRRRQNNHFCLFALRLRKLAFIQFWISDVHSPIESQGRNFHSD